jgi:predicted transposase/invertase (TIGR01784 family)
MLSALERERDRQYYEKLAARQDGQAEGRAETRYEIAAKALSRGMSMEDITELTGLTAEELASLR